MAAPTQFTSLASAVIANADMRRTLVVIHNLGAGTLYVRLAPGTVNTSTAHSFPLASGGTAYIGPEYTGVIMGIFGAAGTANVTVTNPFN